MTNNDTDPHHSQSNVIDTFQKQTTQSATSYQQIQKRKLIIFSITGIILIILTIVTTTTIILVKKKTNMTTKLSTIEITTTKTESTTFTRKETTQTALDIFTTSQTTIDSPIKITEVTGNTTWKRNGTTVAGNNRQGNQTNQFSQVAGFDIDDDLTLYIADSVANRVVRWKENAKNGEVIAGGNGRDQLRFPTDVVVDKKNSSLIICDQGSNRLQRVFHHNLTLQPTVILTTYCNSLVIDRNGDIYISDVRNHVVKRWKEGESDAKVIIGGNKTGDSLNQLNYPSHIFVDDDYSIYVSDSHNNRVIKWIKNAKEGIVVSGLYYNGDGLMQLDEPTGIIVDHSGNIYVADKKHFQVVRFLKGSQEGSFVVGETRYGSGPNQLFFPEEILFDQQGNLYVADSVNFRVQKFYVNS